MRENARKFGKILVTIVCTLGGLGSFLQWVGFKPGDLALTPPTPHILWLVASVVFFLIAIGTEIVRSRKIREMDLRLSMFSDLQWDAMELSHRLLLFIREQGHPPAPKYTIEQIQRMPSDEMRRLLLTDDGDYAYSYEYHSGNGHSFNATSGTQEATIHNKMSRLSPWHDKVQAGYALKFEEEVKRMRNRLSLAGLSGAELLLPVEGTDGIRNIATISAKLWEFAYKIEEKRAQTNGLEDKQVPETVERHERE